MGRWEAERFSRGEETGNKRESAMRDCWWEITPASGREHQPVGTEALVAWGDSLVCLEARLGREEAQACNGSLCEHYRGSSRATVLDRRG
jgi:hypothetical protein